MIALLTMLKLNIKFTFTDNIVTTSVLAWDVAKVSEFIVDDFAMALTVPHNTELVTYEYKNLLAVDFTNLARQKTCKCKLLEASWMLNISGAKSSNFHVMQFCQIPLPSEKINKNKSINFVVFVVDNFVFLGFQESS